MKIFFCTAFAEVFRNQNVKSTTFPNMKRILKYPLFRYDVFAEDLEVYFENLPRERPLLVSTINPHSFYVAEHDQLFKTALRKSHVLLPDGVGVVFAIWLINGKKINRISGMDIFLYLLRKLDAEKNPQMKRVFFLGSTDDTLSLIHEKIRQEYPTLSIGSYSPPFKPTFNEAEVNFMVEKINVFNPHVLFVGMTAPKQEKWAYANLGHLKAELVCSIGAVFDFYSENLKRPGKIWQTLGLEWFRRLIGEPKRLWKRSLISLPYFLTRVCIEAFKKRLIIKR